MSDDPSTTPMINIRDLSVRCGQCMNFMTLEAYDTRGDWNAYTFVCETGCDPAAARTVIEVPTHLDLFAQRHPECGGGCSTRR